MNLNKTVIFSKKTVTRGDKELEMATGFQRCWQFCGVAGNGPLFSQQAMTSSVPAKALRVAKSLFYKIYIIGFDLMDSSMNPIQLFISAQFALYIL